MSTDYKAMLESTSKHQPTVSNPVEAVVSSELLYRTFEDERTLCVGFKCRHCGNENMFTAEDADYLEATGKRNITKPYCKYCEKESILVYE